MRFVLAIVYAGCCALAGQVLAAPAPASALVDIRAFGDSAYVAGNGSHASAPNGWVAKNLARIEKLRSPDVNFLNLEASLTRTCKSYATKTFAFSLTPESLMDFAAWGFNLIGLANNHTLDCLAPSPVMEIASALAVVQRKYPGLRAHGLAETPAILAHVPAILKVRGVRLGMVSMKVWPNGRRSRIGNLDNRAALFDGLRRAAVDVRILSLHGGVESVRRPSPSVVRVAREFLARYDGDIVFAHHPHVAQGFEVVRKANGRLGVIFFSLGNSLHNGLSAAGDGLAARVRVGKQGIDATSLAVFPLAAPANGPTPWRAVELPDIAAKLVTSGDGVTRLPLPKSLRRVKFTLEKLGAPLPGLRLVLGSTLLAAERAPPSRRRALAKQPRISGAVWIPPVVAH